MRLIQVMGIPTTFQIKFVEQLLEHTMTLFSRLQQANKNDMRLKPLVLQLGVAVRKGEYDFILRLLSKEKLTLPTTEDTKSRQCLEQIIGLAPKLALARGFGLSQENMGRIQTPYIFGISQASHQLRFTLMTEAQPIDSRDETLLYQALLHHPDSAPFGEPLGAVATWYERFKAWKARYPTRSPKMYWHEVENKCREMDQQFASQ